MIETKKTEKVTEKKSILKLERPWDEVFRPKGMSGVIMPDRILKSFKNGIDGHFLLFGDYGIGKTTLMYALAHDSGYEYKEWNGSETRGMDTVREIKAYIQTMSMRSPIKLVLIDEFDKFTKDAQDALRNMSETYVKQSRFIVTGNFREKITDAMGQRFEEIDFTHSREENIERIAKYKERVKFVLTHTDKEISDEAMSAIIKTNYPSLRSVLKSLQKTVKVMSEDKKVIEVSDIQGYSVAETDVELYEFITKSFTPEQVNVFIRPRYTGKELDCIKSLSSNYMGWLGKNKMHNEVCLVAVVTSKYAHIMTTGCVDKLCVLIACVYELSLIFKK